MKKLILMTTAVLALGASKALADELTVVSWGGAYQASQKKAYFEPYNAMGNKITEAEYNGEVAKIKAMVQAKAVTWDVVDVDAPTAMQACAEGAAEVIDWGKLGIDKSKMIAGDMIDCAVPTIIYSTVFGYDTTKIKDGPTKLADLYDTAKFPGKRGLWKNPQVNLEFALIADGVPSKDVYKVLGTKEGQDRAFKKLDSIKKDIVWWESGAQAPQLLADGQVVMTTGWNGRLQKPIDDGKPFKIVWDNMALDWDFWMITKGTPKLDAAYKFLNFASSPKAQAEQTKFIAYGPANKEAIPNIDAKTLPNLPTAPDNLKTSWSLNYQFWSDNGDALKERFNAWIAK